MCGWKLLALILLGTISAQAQKNTTYWQQKVDYRIDVELNDEQHMLHGHESLTYTNNSPDTLSFIIFHIWPNAYKNRSTALAKQILRSGETKMAFADQEDLGYIDSLSFTVDGKESTFTYHPEHIDICTIQLSEPLLPKGQIEIATPFRVKLPSGALSRLGHIGQSYQITQWYPKPAVYDNKGWHAMPYLNQGEFYSEFGTYDVNITVPENYTLGSTGDLQNQQELERLDNLAERTSDWLTKLEKDDSWSEAKSTAFPESDTATKTLNYIQSDVHDFAWFADKQFKVLKGKVELPHSKREVILWTMFTPSSAKLWNHSIEYMHDAVHYYSLWNGDYPYAQATAVDGTISAGGGMEYPNVTVIGETQTAFLLETVIMHEIGHNWFYGILGSNEREHPWMDEGLNSYNELRYLNTKYPDGKMIIGTRDAGILEKIGLTKYRPGSIHYWTYLLSARSNKDQPMTTSSADYSTLNYGAVVYSKSAVVFDYLCAYLGDELMDEVMQAYFDAFKFKHPQPEDFERIAEEVSDVNLSWLFDGLIESTGKIDYKISHVKSNGDSVHVKLKNKGNINSPVPLTFSRGNENKKVWVAGFENDTSITVKGNYSRVEIDANWRVPEVKRQNNYSNTKGLFKRIEPLKLSVLGSLEDPRQTQLHYLPIVGMNVPSGIMPGIALYNSIIPVKKFNFLLMPMFSTKAITPTGYGEAYYMFTPNESWFQSIDLGVKSKRYVYRFGFDHLDLAYNRVEPYLRFDFKKPNPAGYFNHEVSLSSVYVNQENYQYTGNNERLKGSTDDFYQRLQYDASFDHPIYKTGLVANAEQHNAFLKTSLTLQNRLNVLDKITVSSRGFAGYFIANTSNDPRYNWRMDGQSGRSDYAFDATLLDRSRSDDILSQQMTMTHGAFKTPNAVGQSNSGLFAFNVEIKPNKLPLGVFADVGYSLEGEMLYDAGAQISLFQGLLNVYAPLVYSANIGKEVAANGRGFLDLIRFQIGFNALNLIELRRKFDP